MTVSHEAGELRLAKLPDIRKAKKKPLNSWAISDLGIDDIPERSVEYIRLEPPKRDRECEFIEADTPEEAGKGLAEKLIEDGVLAL